jgi:hypothetical protein
MRPTDWSPLRGSDPTPGDPDAVGDQARHYADVAAELRAQVSRLRRIGRDGDLRGQYAERLREAAEELAGDLQQVERRYSRVAAALRRWEPQLRDGQHAADRIRGRAQDLDDERRLLRRQASDIGGGNLPLDATPAQQAAFDADQAAAERIRRRLEDIEDDLRRLDRELGSVEDRVDGDGRGVAADIRAAIDDCIEDTTWEDVKGAVGAAWRAVDAFIDQHIDAIKKIVELLQIVATILAVAALFIPGINLLVVGIAAGVVALSQSVLYASGNATFTDLALAWFALATLGLGKLATLALRGARGATLAAAAPRAGARAAASARAETRAARTALGNRLGRRLQPAQRAQTRAQLNALQARTRAEASRRAARAESQYLDKPLMQASRRESLLDGGEVMNARYANDIARTRRQFPVPEVVAAGRWATPALHVARGNFAAGSVADFGSLLAGKSELAPDKPYSHQYENFKDSWDPIR